MEVERQEVERRRKRLAINMQEEEVTFVEALKRANTERIRVEEEKKALAGLKFEEHCKERERARKERREEREAAAGLELRKMRLMLEMAVRRDCGGGTGSKVDGSDSSKEEVSAPPP